MTKEEQARQRLVEIALDTAEVWRGPLYNADLAQIQIRTLAGFRDPSRGPWCAAGLTAAMEKAGLVVPSPGTPARRGAIALLDFLHEQRGATTVAQRSIGKIVVPDDWQTAVASGDVIAWLQRPPPDPAGWRRGHVAVIVATDSESITTVGWNEGASPGRVMMRRLWRDHERLCGASMGSMDFTVHLDHDRHRCRGCRGTGRVRPIDTVLYRQPGGLYGIARPVAA